MKKLILLLSLLVPILCYSQVGLPYDIHSKWNDFHLNKIKDGSSADFEYEGSPYLNDDFKIGQITLEDGQLITNVPLRYNVYNDKFEIEKDGFACNIPNERIIKEFICNKEHFIYRKYSEGNKNKIGYIIPLFNQKCCLYKKHKVIMHFAKKAEAFKKAVPATFIKKPPLYLISFNDQTPKTFKNLKTLIKLLPNKQNEITKYIKDNNLKLKKETEIIQVLEFYNTL